MNLGSFSGLAICPVVGGPSLRVAASELREAQFRLLSVSVYGCSSEELCYVNGDHHDAISTTSTATSARRC